MPFSYFVLCLIEIKTLSFRSFITHTSLFYFNFNKEQNPLYRLVFPFRTGATPSGYRRDLFVWGLLWLVIPGSWNLFNQEITLNLGLWNPSSLSRFYFLLSAQAWKGYRGKWKHEVKIEIKVRNNNIRIYHYIQVIKEDESGRRL